MGGGTPDKSRRMGSFRDLWFSKIKTSVDGTYPEGPPVEVNVPKSLGKVPWCNCVNESDHRQKTVKETEERCLTLSTAVSRSG